MTKEEVIRRLSSIISIAENRANSNLTVCINGAKDTLRYLKESNDAKSTEVKSVSKGEIDGVIAEIEKYGNTWGFSREFTLAINKLLNYVKTAALMPAEPSEDAMNAMYHRLIGSTSANYSENTRSNYVKMYKGLYEHLTTSPKPKMKKVWCFSAERHGNMCLSMYDTLNEAEVNRSDCVLRSKGHAQTVKYISPIWQQEVPDA